MPLEVDLTPGRGQGQLLMRLGRIDVSEQDGQHDGTLGLGGTARHAKAGDTPNLSSSGGLPRPLRGVVRAHAAWAHGGPPAGSG